VPTLGLPSPRRRAKDILAKRRRMALATPVRNEGFDRVRRRLEARGHSVESTLCDENGGLPRRRHKRRLKVDGKLCSWHRMFNSIKGRKNASPRYSATTICRFTLEKTKFVLLDIAPPRCRPMMLKVPSKALPREFFSGTGAIRRTFTCRSTGYQTILDFLFSTTSFRAFATSASPAATTRTPF
jgi:hypothetical protein